MVHSQELDGFKDLKITAEDEAPSQMLARERSCCLPRPKGQGLGKARDQDSSFEAGLSDRA